jgi:urea transport system substrate-binding protein
MQRRSFIKQLALSAALATAGILAGAPAFAADTIKVGVLHSLSGTMAISETVLKDVTLMTIDEINAKGGVLGKNSRRSLSIRHRTAAVRERRGSSSQDKVSVVFGCWTSVSRKSVLRSSRAQRAAVHPGAVRG